MLRHPFILIGVSFIVFGLFYGPLIGYNVKFISESSGDLTVTSDTFSPSIYIACSLKKDDTLIATVNPIYISNETQSGLILTTKELFDNFRENINNIWASFTASNRSDDDIATLNSFYKTEASWLINSSYTSISNVINHTLDFSAFSNLNAIVAIIILNWNETPAAGFELMVEINRTRDSEFLLAGSSLALGFTIQVCAIFLTQKSHQKNITS
jgi:hypothetical protein